MARMTLVWLRNDLRVHDHEPLTLALEDSDAVVVLFCIDPRQFVEVNGIPKTGAHRARFLLESVAALRTRLRSLGGELVVRRGRPEDLVPALAEQVGAHRVCFHEEVATEERAVEHGVTRALAARRIEALSSWGHTLLHPLDLPFAMTELPELFTQFRKQSEHTVRPRPVFAAPERVSALPSGLEAGAIPSVDDLGLLPSPQDPRQLTHFEGGEAAGLARLERWMFQVDALRTYKETRNGLLSTDDSSKLSPWLALGCVSPRTVYEAIRRYERERVANDSTYWMFFELLWRDYFRFVFAKHGARLFLPGGLVGATIEWSHDRGKFDAWRFGNTGYPLVDAAMRELAATGNTSNRARQNVASFLTKNLGIDWRWGAQWFESVLVDYDVTSNWGNWAYSGGVGNDARGFRFFNLAKQAADYDPNGDFPRHWLPELAPIAGERIYHPDELSPNARDRLGIRLGHDYPAPIVDFRRSSESCRQVYERGMATAPRKPGGH